MASAQLACTEAGAAKHSGLLGSTARYMGFWCVAYMALDSSIKMVSFFGLVLLMFISHSKPFDNDKIIICII